MYRAYRQSLRKTLRYCSTIAKKDISTEEKAGEVGEALWAKFSKYGLVIVPSVIMTIVSIDIINKPHHRDVVEEYLPTYGKTS